MQTSGGATALMYACQQCRETEVLELLRKHPSSVRDRDRTLKTPLHYCAENPNTSCAEAILKAAPELVNAQDENGYCSLHLAVIGGNKPLIKLLISKGADVNIHDNEGHSAVHWAIVSSEKEALEVIMRAGANPSTPDIHGGYPLHYAVQMCGSNCEFLRSFEDTIRVVECLLNVGVDVNVKDKDGRQPILWAASAGSADAVIHLVSSGACVEAADKDGLTALHCAASRGHTTTLETLISLCGANVDVIDGNGCSALFYSVTLGHADATELLLKLGAEPNRQDRKGRTPAHCGAAKGQLETLRILQKHGGNLWMRNVKGDLPLHEAVASGRKDLVIWLLSQNSDAINLANNDGRCALHIASMYNNTEMVKVLLDSKSLVNPVMRTSKGVLMTPLNVALCKGHRSCGKYLQLHGGVPFSKVSRAEPTTIFAVRVSPSDGMMTESRIENVASSPSKISKSRSSSDILGNQEILKTETTDKKKVYRRRKKKKTPSNVNTQDSDSGSGESVHELKVKIIDNRKSEKSGNDEDMDGDDDDGNDEDEEMIKKMNQQDTKTLKKDKSPKSSSNGRKPRSNQKQKISEVFLDKRATKIKTESKILQRSKSFNETKNVSDLSPEDFPPRMQVINQLDTVIMEPDVDINKSECENNEFQLLNIAVPEVSTENVTIQFETKEERTEEPDIVGDSLPNDDENVQNNNNKKDEESTLRTPQEESMKVANFKNSNEGNRKDELDLKIFGLKSPEDEGSDKKSVKNTKNASVEGLLKKDLNKTTEGLEKHKESGGPEAYARNISSQIEKSPNAKVSDKKEEIEKVEKISDNENDKDEKTKTEPEIKFEAMLDQGPIEENAEGQQLEPENLEEELIRKERKAEETQIHFKEEKSAAENAFELVQEKEGSKLPEAEVPVEEVKIVKEEEPSDISDKKENKFLVEFKDTERLEPSIETENLEPSYPFEVFESKISQSSFEKNPSEREVVENPVERSCRNEENPDQEIENRFDKLEESRTCSVKSKANGEKSYVLGEEVDQLNKHDDKECEGDEFPIKKFNRSEQKHHKTPRISRLCRRHREFKDDINQISVTQLVQNTIRKYHMERGIFYQLLELKRYQIRSGKANEQVLVKRLADEYDRSRVFLGMKPFSGLYRFREFEKFLYDQLKALNSRRSFLFPEIKSYNDIEALSSFLKKSRYKTISEIPQCTCITQRCHHSACAYTSVPCSAYITDLRRHRQHKSKRESFFPQIEHSQSLKSTTQKFTERPATLELIQGSEKHVITLPQSSPPKGKRYYVTFTIKGAPGFKEEDFPENSKDYSKHRHSKSV